MKNCLTTTEKEQLTKFFCDEISKEAFAKITRKLLYISIMQNLQSDSLMYKEELAEGYYWLTNFLEILDPTGILE